MRVTKKALVSLSLAAALALPGIPARAAEDVEPGAVSMSLRDCLTKALEQNLDLRSARLDPELQLNAVTFQRAAFDPILGAETGYSKAKTKGTQEVDDDGSPTTPAVYGKSTAESDNWGLVGSIAQLLKFGGSYRVTATRDDGSSSNNRFDPQFGLIFDSSSDPIKTWGVRADVRVPLLKGFGNEVNTINLVLAENDLKLSEEELRRQAEAVVKEVESAYWDVAAARAAVRVSKQSLKLAQDLFDLNKKKVEVGTLAPIEITQAEAGVASREEGVIVAENLLRNAEDNLRRLLAIPANDPLWSAPILPTDQPTSGAVSIDLDAAMQTAMENRPEIENAKVALESNELSERVAKKNVRHQLDLTASAATTRIDTESLDLTTPTPAIPFFQDFDGARRPDWSVGLLYAYPIGNRAAKSSYANAQIAREKSALALETTEQDVRVDVRAAVRAVDSGAKRVAAAHANTILQQKTVDAELKKFENGMSTSFEVLRIQTDLADAQVAEIRAVLDYNKALADLERAKGTLLEAKGLELGANGGN